MQQAKDRCCHCTSSGQCCGSGSIPGLGISTCCRPGQIKQKLKQNTQKNIESKKTDFASELANADFDIENTAKIIFEKPLDNRNKVVLFEYNARKYLVLTGSSNVLLDRFGEDNIRTQSDFELFFEQNKNMLANFISKRTNSLENYKNNLGAE